MTTEPPILDLEKIDLIEEREGGGIDLEIVATGPLTADIEVQQLLLAKVETYLCYVNSTGFRRKHGSPTQDTITVVVSSKHPVDQEIEDLVERMKSWANDNCASICLRAEVT